MTNDIEMTAENWIPIGIKDSSPKVKKYFSGIFDGDGHVISNLKMSEVSHDYNALFGVGNGMTIRNLTLSNLAFTPATGSVGGFLGASANAPCFLENCKIVDSVLSGSSQVGALVRRPDLGVIITDCVVSNVTLSGGTAMGAILGSPSTMSGTTYCTNVVVYASGDSAIGAANSGSYIYIRGASTLMDIASLAPEGCNIRVDAGLYSVAIPSNYLDEKRKNQRETIGEDYWYRVVESHDGTGTKNDPYILEDEDKLIEMAADPDKYSGTYIKMNADIELTKNFATAFGSDAKPFGGNFDGNNFSITCGDFVTADSFFGTVSNLVVTDLGISLTKPLIGKVSEGYAVSVADTTVGAPVGGAVVTANNGTLAFDNVVVTNAASALIANNAGAATVTGEDTDMDVAAICGSGSTGTMLMDNGRFHCTIPADYVAQYYKIEADAVEGWNKIVPNKGSGTAEDPWILMCEDDILEFVADMCDAGTKYAASHIKIANDITMTTAISPTTKQFTGVFDGNGKTIYGLTVTTGLFGDIKGTVKNLTLANGSATSGSTGLLATKVSSGSLIAGCKLMNCTIAATKNAGAMLGDVNASVVSNCVVEATSMSIGSQKRCGFIVGHISGGNLLYGCFVTGCTLSGGSQKGALIGYPDGNLTLINCVVEDSTSLPIIGTLYSAQTGHTLTIDGADTSLDVTKLWGDNNEYGTVAIYAGEFSFDPTDYVPSEFAVQTFTKSEDTWYRVTPAGAKIGTKGYPTLLDAFKAAVDGDTITLLADTEQINETIADINGIALTLDLNGYTIDAKCWDIRGMNIHGVNGSLTIVDSSDGQLGVLKKEAFSGGFIDVYDGGTFTLTGGTVMYEGTSANNIVRAKANGHIVVTGGKMLAPNASVGYMVRTTEAGATAVISGGQICGVIQNYENNGTITIPTGSTARFDRDQSKFCATGYATYKANWNSEYYTVAAARSGYDYKVWFVVNGAEEAYAVSNVVSDTTVGKPADPSAPEGYVFKAWTNATYTAGFDFATLITADTVLHAYFEEAVSPVEPGTDIPSADPAADAEAINASVDAKKKVLAPPTGATVTDTYYTYFSAVPGTGVVTMELNESGTNAVVEAQTSAATNTLAAVLSAESATSVTVAKPLAGFYYSLKQGGALKTIDYKTGAKNLIGGKDTITFELDKPESSGFYQMIVTPNAVE